MGGTLRADAFFPLFVVYLFYHYLIICHPQKEDFYAKVCKRLG